jgi:small-conductance mechanosensitive channel
VNYTANPKRRMEFTVGIGYEDEPAAAQAAALAAVRAHEAVLREPEPLVLVDSLGASTVDLRIYFWYDGLEFDGLKVRSALIRAVKRALEEAGCSMPDAAREVIFPKGVPISREGEAPHAPPRHAPRPEVEAAATAAEGGLDSDRREIQTQARESRSPEEGGDLLARDDGGSGA